MTAAFSRGYSLPSRATVLWILSAGPWAILALTLVGEVLWSKRFERRMRRGVASRLNPTLPATFAGIHPGRGVRYTEGYADWDFGFVSLEGDWLCYRGEKVRFAIPRQDVREVSIVKGPPNWVRERRVEVVFPGGAFTMNVSYANPTMAIARRTAKWIQDWVSQTSSAMPSSARPEPPPPLLPNLPGIDTSRLGAFWYLSKTAIKLLLVGPLAAMAGFNSGLAVGIIVLVAPMGAFLRILPAIIWPIRQPRAAADVRETNPLGETAPT